VLSDLSLGFPQQPPGYRLAEAQVGTRPEGPAPGAGAPAPAPGRDWRELQQSAQAIDNTLRGLRADGGACAASGRFQTLVHGDFKSENILLSADGSAAAAYDFQYCGAGLGAKDVAYLFCSSLDADVLQRHEQALLAHYHARLLGHLARLGRGGEGYTAEVLQRHYELALLDYCRHMAGWGWWGNAGWARARARALLQGGRLQELLRG
jgi:aminoglycoside phosphotransferase (APT) family kinase protein